ncbi:hypothetical protein DRN97_06265 [Methanosarcinales archaeon]|nr:MAG: hypothetical protein DRN97_06265 [Methanosarcinales archaeon]
MNGPNNKIGWTDYTWNPVKGLCPVGCPYCYARRIYDRFHYDPTIRLDEKELQAPYKIKKPAKIFVGSTIELFGEWTDDWMERILKVCSENPQHRFQFLTKLPGGLTSFDFPDNCWLGITITFQGDSVKALWLKHLKTPVRFVSIEPLLGEPTFLDGIYDSLDWIIIGAETGNRKGKVTPKEIWIKNILAHARDHQIPVFMKHNLRPHWQGELRQEFPEDK